MDDQNIKKTKKIIENIIYITLATVDANGNPWNSPVFAAFDEKYNFYWRSAKDAMHSQNIRTNNKVFIAIYDSTIPFGAGEGVYIKAKVTELHNINEIVHAITILDSRAPKKLGKADNYIETSPRSIYKATPEKIWINVDGEIDGFFVDKRLEIKLP